MDFTPKQIKLCLDMAQNLREAYFHSSHNAGHTHISVNALLHMVQTTYGKKVTLYFHDDSYEDHHVYSLLYVDKGGSYHICLMSKMSNCWNRFALCKELFHVILDEEDVRNSSLINHLRDFRSSMIDSDNGGRDSSKSEFLTEFAAMQFLFPYAKRLDCLKEIDNRTAVGESKKAVFTDIATRLRIPRLLTEDYLGNTLIDLFDPISWIDKSDNR
ncbi:MAG: hypothetical protein WAT12_15860 [Candidatus Nitrotoga sp.]